MPRLFLRQINTYGELFTLGWTQKKAPFYLPPPPPPLLADAPALLISVYTATGGSPSLHFVWGLNLLSARGTALSPDAAAAASDTKDTMTTASCNAASPSPSRLDAIPSPLLLLFLLIRHFPFGDVERQEDRVRKGCVW